ncbi:pyrroloquinoline quinone-dependent dehydrogenase [Lysinibacillus odysseyi]|uniref:pyrroloquinoline quinone-dependent dehydrogenase n=1 Tax=Lysinibacillus odysseyi TaxID=202611 RepID=UPI0006924B68|nr:PQQ-binding-like beta-propeller repeat protein [Lysinibacillus odysseyi]
MDFRKAWLQILLAVLLGGVFIGGIAYLSALITKNTLSDNESNGHRGGYAIFTPESKERTAEYAEEEWATYGGDYFNRRYSQLADVNLGTIQDLKPAWAADLGPGINNNSLGEAVPIVVDDVMYVAVGLGDVVALHAKTGEKLWTYHPDLQETKEEVCCSRSTRSVAVAEGKVYVSRLDATLVALDQKNGEVIWEKEAADSQQGYNITTAPLYYNNKIYIGVSGGKAGTTGSLVALDAKDGRDVWTFDGIPGKTNEISSLNESQEHEVEVAPIWNTPAVDTESGTIYFAAGYAASEPASQAEEDSLNANLIIAVNAKTGEYKWHFQDESIEKWSVDASNPVVLFDVEQEGEKKKVLGQAGKQGWVYLLDRESGVPLFKNEELSAFEQEGVESAAEHPPSTVQSRVHSTIEKDGQSKEDPSDKSLASVFTPFWDFPVIEPSLQKTSNWQPSAYSPKTEYYYVLGEQKEPVGRGKSKYVEGRMNVAGIKDRASNASSGLLTAFDVRTNEVAWQVNWQHTEYTSLLATAGDIIFAGSDHGRISALHAATGQEVWSYETGADSNTPAITYEIDGEQYIAVLAVGKTMAGDVYRQKIYTFSLNGAWDGVSNIASPLELTE